MGPLDSDTLLPNEIRATYNMIEFDYSTPIFEERVVEHCLNGRRVKVTKRMYWPALVLSRAAKAVIDRNGLGTFTVRWNGALWNVFITAPDETSATLFRLAF